MFLERFTIIENCRRANRPGVFDENSQIMGNITNIEYQNVWRVENGKNNCEKMNFLLQAGQIKTI